MTDPILQDYLNSNPAPLKETLPLLVEAVRKDERERRDREIVEKINNTEVFYGNPRFEKMMYYEDVLKILSTLIQTS